MHSITLTKPKYIHVMKYMGSKRELLDDIEKIADSVLSPGDVLLDLFSGSCGVGIHLREKYSIYVNDIQRYSKCICEGIIESGKVNVTINEVINLIHDKYKENYNYVSKKLQPLLKKFQYFKQISVWDKSLLKEYLAYIKELPEPSNPKAVNKEQKWLIDTYHKNQHNNKSFPYIQTTYLFSEMYFGLDQAIEIDSIKYAIDSLPEEYEMLAKVLMVALMHAYSYVSAGTGHFAQFRDLSSVESVADVSIYRKKSTMDYLFRKTEEILTEIRSNQYFSSSKSFNMNYLDLLKDKKIMSKVKLIYADPPYSFVHYSRFYHAVENLCKYDYPDVEHKGRYRKDRHQSPFCIKTQVGDAFRNMYKEAYKNSIPILTSYSNTGMISLENILTIAREEGFKVSIKELDHKHSTMGRQKDKNRDVKEALILCKI